MGGVDGIGVLPFASSGSGGRQNGAAAGSKRGAAGTRGGFRGILVGVVRGPARCYYGRNDRKSMPKLKTHSGAAKRFKKTASGKFKRGHSKMRHILTSKATKTKRKLGGSALISDADHYNVSRMLPYD